jgi:hypothetical protein
LARLGLLLDTGPRGTMGRMVVAEIIERANGIPLFVEEMMMAV